MRILYHHRTLGDGAEGIHIREMIRAFRELGNEVRVIGPVGETRPDGSRASTLGRIKSSLPSAVFELAELAYSGYIFFRAAWEVFRFSPDFIYDRYIAFNFGMVLAARLLRVPIVLEVNAPLALERQAEADERLTFRRLASAIERWTCANATRTIVVSTPLRDYLESIGVPPGKCVVMPNGADPLRFAPRPRDERLREKLGIPRGSVVIGFTGVLRAWHGLDLLVRAVGGLVAKGHDVFLLIVGDGPYRGVVEDMVRDLGLERSVLISGRLSHEEVPTYVALFDVAVSPRATFYASPMKVIEYMALAKPVVVPRTPNFHDIVEDRVDGVTFGDGDAEELEAALQVLCVSPEHRATLGAQARRKVETRLNWRWNAARSCELAGEAR